MDLSLNNFGSRLNEFIDKDQPDDAEKFILKTTQDLTNNEVSSGTRDSYILNIFNRSNGILWFLNKVLREPKYKKAKLSSFTLLHTMINNNVKQAQNYLPDTIQTTSMVVRSAASAIEKQKSLELIALIVSKGKFVIHYGSDNCVITNLYEILYKCLHCRFDKSDIVQEQLIKTIGVIAKKFPSVINNDKELLNLIIVEISNESQKSKKSYPVLSGHIEALSNVLENFSINIDVIYKILKNLINPGDAHRRGAFRAKINVDFSVPTLKILELLCLDCKILASMSFFTKHITLTCKHIYRDAEWWHKSALSWFDLGLDDKKTANSFLKVFYLKIADILSCQTEDYDKGLFKYFISYFESVIAKKNEDSYLRQLAICALGQFSKAFKVHSNTREIDRIFGSVCYLIEDTYILNFEENAGQMIHLPHYIEALSSIIKNQTQLNKSNILLLEKISVMSIKLFPQLSPAQHYLVIESFTIMLTQLRECSNNLENFLEDVLYQGVMWTCSHRIALEEELNHDSGQEICTYKKYMAFWKGILSNNINKYEKYDISSDTVQDVVKIFFSQLIGTHFTLVNKLNLNIKCKDNTLSMASIDVSYEAVQANDFVIFINIVDFYQEVFDEADGELLRPWIINYTNEMLAKAIKFPFVSGFYKLLACSLKHCENLNIFEKINSSASEVTLFHESVCKFLQNTLQKMKQFRGDLQISCMRLILAAPISIVKIILPSLVPTFETLFDIGRSYLPLASIGIDTLNKWFKCIPDDEYEPFLRRILPSLDSYLQTKLVSDHDRSATTFRTRKTKKAINKQKILVETESELFQVQIKVLTFIGQLNSDLCSAFVTSKNNLQPRVLNNKGNLKMSLPFEGAKVELYLDQMVPRIVELAMSSSNRKIRITACEVLHALVMILLGTSHPLDSKKLVELEGLVEIIIEAVLALGCDDTDQVVQQLFCPLALQLMHYYSHPRQIENFHTQIIIKLLIEGVSNHTNSSLRDFCGKCIKEYVSWSIKQISQSDLLKNSINIKVWIRVINSFCVHPDLFKRLGAALIFNNIYFVLREEHHMFDMYWLEILNSFVTNLSLMGVCDNDSMCIDQVYRSLEHLKRGFVEKHHVFNTPSNVRRTPYGFGGNLLKDVAIWLLKRTGCINSYCRSKCMSLLETIVPLIQGCNGLQTFVTTYLVDDLDWISRIYEEELKNNSHLDKAGNNRYKWLQGLLCALDGYIFVITNNLTANVVFTKSTFFASLQIFLKKVDHLNFLTTPNPISNTTIMEEEKFNKLTSSISYKILELLFIILRKQVDVSCVFGTNEFWNNYTWNFVTRITFESNSEVEKDDQILSLLGLTCNLPESILNELTNALLSYMTNNKQLIELDIRSSSVSVAQYQFLRGMSIVQRSAFKEKLNVAKYTIGTVNYLCNSLSTTSDEMVAILKINKRVVDFYSLKLDISLENEQELLEMLKFISKQSDSDDMETEEDIKYGLSFFDTFKETLFKHLLKNHKLFINQLFQLETIHNLLNYAFEFLKYAQKKKNHSTNKEIIAISLENMEKRLSYFNENVAQMVLGLEFLNQLTRVSVEPLYNLLPDKSKVVVWVIDLLRYDEPNWSIERGFNFISEVISIIPWIIGPGTACSLQLRAAFTNLKTKYFNKTNVSMIAMKTTFLKFLHAMKVSRSNEMFLCFIDIFLTVHEIVEPNHSEYLLKQFIIKSEDQNKTICLLYKMSFESADLKEKERYVIAKNVLPILLQYCSYDSFENFFVAKIKTLRLVLNQKNNSSFNTCDTVNRTIVLIMIELLFSRIKLENLENNSCRICKACFPEELPSKRTIIKSLTSGILEIFKENYNLSNEEEKRIFRRYQCHNYNALVSIVSTTQKDEKFYTLLFKREENKQDVLWTKIVDLDKKYEFPIDFDEVPRMKKSLLSIRNNLQVSKRDVTNPVEIKYLESQHLFNSTLSEDITRFDFTGTTLRTSYEYEQSRNKNETESKKMEIGLEAIPINEHECMGTICGLIQYIFDNGVCSLPTTKENVVLPVWMKEIRNTLTSSNTRDNVKVYLIKIIHNTQHIFKYYAKWFLGPIINAIISHCFGTTINFVVADLIMMLNLWNEFTAVEDDVELKSALLKFCVQNSDNANRAIFKYNLELVKLILETWGGALAIPHEIIFDKLSSELNSQKVEVGVHLTAVVLANKIAPWAFNNIPKFLKKLVKTLASDRRQIFQPCSEVIGMSLHFMSEDQNLQIHLAEFTKFIGKSLDKYDDNKFAYCLEGISPYYPSISDEYLCKMVAKVSHLIGNFKTIYLRIFGTRVDQLESMNELFSIDFDRFLSDNDVEVQVLTLELIHKSTRYFKGERLVSILEQVFKFVYSLYGTCRTVAYDIFISVYYMHLEKTNDESKKVIRTCTDALLLGLVDKDLLLQEKVINFWSNSVDLPRDVSKRMLHLLRHMYNSDVEEQYVGYSAYLLLNLISLTQEFNEKLFQFSLHDCEFQEYKLNSNWRMQHISTAPLFVESIKSQETNFSLMDFDVLRATISSYEFEPTRAEDVPSTSKIRPTQVGSRTSSLLFTMDDSSGGNEVFKDPNKVLPKVWGFRGRRFLKDRSKISRHYAHLETKKALKAEEVRKEKVKENERKVTIYRKYRIGDYPDIEITLAAILTPLQLLAKFDANLSRGLYTNIFISVFDKLHKSNQLDSMYIKEVNSSINDIFNNSTDYVPSMIATFLDIALKFNNILTFEPDTISNVCEWSGLYSIGSLILEEYLISKMCEEPPGKKCKGVAESEKNLHWIKYARLNKDMGEWDVVTSIFMEKLMCNETTLKAIEAECSAQWRCAQESYYEVLQEDVCRDQKDFYYESYFECFAALGGWKELSSNIERSVNVEKKIDVWSSLWNDDWKRQKLLSWYIKAELRNLLSGDPTELFTSINASLSEEEKLEHLKLYHGEEIAMLWLLQGDNEVAKFYLNFAIQQFLKNWLHLNPLLVKLRLNKAMNLQTLIDIYVFVNEFDKINSENYQTLLPVFLKCWEPKFQSTIEPLLLNETRTIYRSQFVSTMTSKLRGVLTEDEILEVTDNFNELKFKMYLNLVECALEQGNYFLARKYIKLSPKPEKTNIYQNMRRSLILSKALHLRSQACSDNGAKLNDLISSLKSIPDENSTLRDDILCCSLKTNVHICDLSEDICKVVTIDNKLFSQNKTALQKYMKNISLSCPEDINKFGVRSLQKSLNDCESAVRTMMCTDHLKVYECMANANVKLAYCVQNDAELENVFIVSVLRAMKLGSIEGRQLFPCLLKLNIGTTFKDDFTNEVVEIPIWMFLAWIPQMLAYINESCIFVTKDILTDIARTYPQAIIYAYRLSKEKFNFGMDSIGDAGREITKQLDDILLIHNLDDFLKGMRCVSVPAQLLRDNVLKLRLCSSKAEFDTALKQVLEEIYFEIPDYKNAGSFQGALFKSIEKYKNKLITISKREFVPETHLTALTKLVNELKALENKSSKLVEYSPWLANYQVRESQFNLEIPGQYTGETRPLVEHHVKIMGFASTVRVLQSIRKPIKITIIGNNAKEYEYLVKYGEDLRQDQRIQQLLVLMNKILSKDLQCHKRQLYLNTYQVIPLTDRLGIIEWITGAKELTQFVEDGCESYEQQSIIETSEDYMKWISKACPVKNRDIASLYGNACLHYDRNSTICKYRTLVSKVPINVLKKAFWNICANSESFFAFRNKFATSYAVTCIAHWLLGIGDRHLSNTLISIYNGETIGIDFGHAFGSGTQMLQVPELVPFRLTPHILSLLEPLCERGSIQETMIHSLRAFRSNSNILLATMSVFIKEPSLDWLEWAKKLEMINTVHCEWYPVQKLRHAELKLKGENSVNIMIEELTAGHSQRPNFLKAYIDLVKGEAEHNYRARKSGNLTEEEQVKCLLDHATDHNLLGRMYVGWKAWI